MTLRVYSVHLGTKAEIGPGALRDQVRAVLADAAPYGRVFEDEPFVPTLNGLKLGPGPGLGVRFRGKSLVHVYAARGPDGVVVSSRTGWVF
jgi:hypothetical protein